jgi:hypothetical protein
VLLSPKNNTVPATGDECYASRLLALPPRLWRLSDNLIGRSEEATMATHTARAKTFTVGFAAVVLVLAGCGDSGAVSSAPATPTSAVPTSSAPPALSADEYLMQISSTCVSTDAAIEATVAAALAAGAPDAPRARQLLLDTVIPSVADEITTIEALDGPSGLEAEVHNLLMTARVELDQLRATANGDDPLSAFGSDPFAQTHRQAASLGIDGCKYVSE